MTKKKKKNSPSRYKERVAEIKEIMQDERVRFGIGLVILFFVLFVVLATISFFVTGGADQSIITMLSDERQQHLSEIQNWTGFRGAIVSDWLINDLFGVASLLLLVFPVVFSLRLMRVKVAKLWRAFLFPTLFAMWGGILLSFLFGSFFNDTFMYVGGVNGLALSRILVLNIGMPGTLLILLGSGIVIALFAFSSTLKHLKAVLFKNSIAKRMQKNTDDSTSDVENTEEIVNEDSVEPVNDDMLSSESLGSEDINSDSLEDTFPIIEEIVMDDEEASTQEIALDSIDLSNDLNEEPLEEDSIPIETSIPTEEEADSVDSAEGVVETVIPDDGEMVKENLEPYDPTLDLSAYKYPTLDLLKQYPEDGHKITVEEQEANQKRILTTLKNYGIGVKKIFETVGPTITLYEIVPEDGIRIRKIQNLEADIMLSLAATGIRIIAPIPGKGTIGIEVPNAHPRIVSMHSVIASKKFQESQYELPIALGRTITNEVFTFDLAKMPHMLVAGATGQGKSVGLNAIITSLLYKKHPSQLRFVLVDPKKVEFNIYSDIDKHFLATLPEAEEPVITDVSKVVETLNSICKEMDDRYDLLKSAHVRNIKEYNRKFINRRLNPEKGHRYMPYIVVVVDEFGDLIMTAGKEVETPIARIAQLARAVGIHMILATQRPSVNIITGVIKANFPARCAFKVSSGVDSKTILDAPGANQLIGRGDLLFSAQGKMTRVQCAFVDTPEVEELVNYIGDQRGYPTPMELPEPDMPEETISNRQDSGKLDALFTEAARHVVGMGSGSTSNIQRNFNVGFNRAGRIMDQLEGAGIVGPQRGSKPREVLVHSDYDLTLILENIGV
jgi:S-DNA-T family DNA segregation ATPase FtsK/SpoIIIE